MSVLVWPAPVVVTLVENYIGKNNCGYEYWVCSQVQLLSYFLIEIIFKINKCIINYFTYWCLHQKTVENMLLYT